MASRTFFSCPACGEDVPVKARACPHCGACDKSGWNEEAGETDGLDLPEDDFDSEKFNEAEFGVPHKLRGKELFWKVSGVVIVVLMVIAYCLTYLVR